MDGWGCVWSNRVLEKLNNRLVTTHAVYYDPSTWYGWKGRDKEPHIAIQTVLPLRKPYFPLRKMDMRRPRLRGSVSVLFLCDHTSCMKETHPSANTHWSTNHSEHSLNLEKLWMNPSRPMQSHSTASVYYMRVQPWSVGFVALIPPYFWQPGQCHAVYASSVH